MAQYFFDVADANGPVPDNVGSSLDGDDAARTEALRVLTEQVRNRLPDAARQRISVEVSDAERRPVLKARLIVEVEWRGGRPRGAG